MGTRHLIVVQDQGQYRIAQYGQWDGYPSGQGKTVLEFLRTMDRPRFLERLRKCRFLTREELEAYELGQHPPCLSRDAGADILRMVAEAPDGLPLKGSIAFAADSLFCEYGYVIDMDSNRFEFYLGFQKAPLAADGSQRFAGYNDATPEHRSDNYYPIRMVGSWPLDALPSVEDLEKLEDDSAEVRSDG